MTMAFIGEEYSEEQAQAISEWLEQLYPLFEVSELFNNLKLSERQKEFDRFILDSFFNYAYDYCLVGPGSLNTNVIEEICLDIFPRKISADKETFEAVPLILNAFLEWAEQNTYLPDTKSWRNYINKIANKIVAYSQDRRRWGIAKSFICGAAESGFDPTNQQELLAYQVLHNASALKDLASVQEPYKKALPKIGRNDPCLCGSGIKYKKCCAKV